MRGGPQTFNGITSKIRCAVCVGWPGRSEGMAKTKKGMSPRHGGKSGLGGRGGLKTVKGRGP